MAMEPIKESIKMRMLLNEIDGNLFSDEHLTTNPYTIATDIPTEILEDIQSAIDWSKHKANSTKMKHLERDLKWIQQHVEDNKIKLIHIPTENQIADIFTKPLAFPAFSHLMNRFMFTFQY
jgi:histone deacetylase 1/2